MGNKRTPKGKRKSPKRERPGSKSERDARYKLIQALLRNGQLHSFDQVFDYVPITVVASDLHIKAPTLHKYLEDGISIKLKHILTISEFCELTEPEIIRLVINFLHRKDAEKKAKIEKTDALVERIKGMRSSPISD
jgi:hypothetical protein